MDTYKNTYKSAEHINYADAKSICRSIKSFIEYLQDNKDEYYKVGEFDEIMGYYKYIRDYIFTDNPDNKEFAATAKANIKTAMDWTLSLGLNDKIVCYRGLKLKDIKDLDKKHPGICWTFDESIAKSFITEYLDKYTDTEGNPFILKGLVDKDNIDWISSICLNINHPQEHEIRIYDDTKVEDIYIYPMVEPEEG